MALPDSPSNPIAAYARTHPPELRALCDKLQAEIEKALPKSTLKIWHGSPVWFLGENPIVGYTVRQMRVDLMFWSGQLFDEPRLAPLGKDKAAGVAFQHGSDIPLAELRRWLRKSRTIVFDYIALYQHKRQAAAPKSRKRS